MSQLIDIDSNITELLGLDSDRLLIYRELPEDLSDQDIIAKWQPAEMTLNEVLLELAKGETQFNGHETGHSNIFYIRDQENVLRSILLHAFHNGWRISTSHPTRPPLESIWNKGVRVFSYHFEK
jgi:hypothetical protein